MGKNWKNHELNSLLEFNPLEKLFFLVSLKDIVKNEKEIWIFLVFFHYNAYSLVSVVFTWKIFERISNEFWFYNEFIFGNLEIFCCQGEKRLNLL